MVNKCSAVNCRSGYQGQTKVPNLTFHAFPLGNKELLKVWLSRVARKNFTPSKYSKLCSLHFKEEDFIEHSIDQQLRRKRRRVDLTLSRRRLKPGAVPSVFSNFPDYYISKDQPSRSGLALSSSRHENQASLLQMQNEDFFCQQIK